MYRHRRHLSLDSYSGQKPTSSRSSYTLQSSPSSNGPRTAKLQQHTSPLALAGPITPSTPPSIDDESTFDTLYPEVAKEMERMVSSVVNSPTEPITPMSSISSLGLGLPSSMTGKMKSKAAASTASRSLLALAATSENDPKSNMMMRAAVGNYRKRFVSATEKASISPPPPSVTISSPSSPAIEEAHAIARTPLTSQRAFGNQPQQQTEVSRIVPGIANPAHSEFQLAPPRIPHRRAVSAGSLPSLDQIAEWSQRRQGIVTSLVPSAEESVSGTAENFTLVANMSDTLKDPREVYVPPQRRSVSTETSHRSPKAFMSPASSPAIVISPVVSPVSPAKSPQQLQQSYSPTSSQDDRRVNCAKRMVNVLEKRKSLTMPLIPSHGILA